MSSGVVGLDPEIMGMDPVGASRQALERASMTMDDIDLVEIKLIPPRARGDLHGM